MAEPGHRVRGTHDIEASSEDARSEPRRSIHAAASRPSTSSATYSSASARAACWPRMQPRGAAGARRGRTRSPEAPLRAATHPASHRVGAASSAGAARVPAPRRATRRQGPSRRRSPRRCPRRRWARRHLADPRDDGLGVGRVDQVGRDGRHLVGHRVVRSPVRDELHEQAVGRVARHDARLAGPRRRRGQQVQRRRPWRRSRPTSGRRAASGSSRRRMPDPYAVEFELSLWHEAPQLMWSHASGRGGHARAVVSDRQARTVPGRA